MLKENAAKVMSDIFDRNSRILSSIDVPNETGVEIGPLDRPVVTKEDGPILYLDHTDTQGLKEKYARNVGAGLVVSENLVEVDLVADGRPLADILGDRGPVDYIIASHVIEHIPNPIGWLADMATALNEKGRVSLAIPDRRFTFDHFREVSNTAELIEANLEDRERPSPAQIYDYFSGVASIDPAKVWAGLPFERQGLAGHEPVNALKLATRVADNETVPDIHCYVFTPNSFANSLRKLISLNLLPFEVIAFETTQPGSIEFFTTLRKSDASVAERVTTVPILDPILDHANPAPPPPTMQEIIAEIPTKFLLITISIRVINILAAWRRRVFTSRR